MKEALQQFYETFYQVRNSAIIIYDIPTQATNTRKHKLNYQTYSGNVTTHSAKRIKKATDLLVQISPPRQVYNPIIKRMTMHSLSFITLTFSSKEAHLTAKEGHKRLLAPWLLKMKRKAEMRTYIWKAELQQNGQLHYHVTTPSWINYTLIRDEWNTLLRKEGLATTYQSKNGQPQNSTDVHAVYKVKDMAAYLCKYLSKANKTQTTVGKIWDCSINLKSSKLFTTPQPKDFQITDTNASIKDCDRCTIISTNNPIQHFPKSIQRQYKIYLSAVTNYKRDTKTKSLTNSIAERGGLRPLRSAPAPFIFLPEPITTATGLIIQGDLF